MPTYSESMTYLGDRIRMLVGDDPRITEKYMFGGLTFLLNGHILAGCRPDGGVLVSVGKDNHEDAKARPGATEMRQSNRLMSGFFWIDPDVLEDDEVLAEWISFAAAAVAQRPLKVEKPKKPKATKAPKAPAKR